MEFRIGGNLYSKQLVCQYKTAQIIMLTRRLVNPSYKCIRLMDFLCSVPTSLNMETGRLSCKNHLKATVIHNTMLSLLILKYVHLIYTLAPLLIQYKQARIIRKYNFYTQLALTHGHVHVLGLAHIPP